MLHRVAGPVRIETHAHTAVQCRHGLPLLAWGQALGSI